MNREERLQYMREHFEARKTIIDTGNITAAPEEVEEQINLLETYQEHQRDNSNKPLTSDGTV